MKGALWRKTAAGRMSRHGAHRRADPELGAAARLKHDRLAVTAAGPGMIH